MLVLRIADSQDALACGAECDTEIKGSTIRGGVGNEDAVGQSADEEVALFGECGRDSVLCGGKGREDEQSAIFEGWLEFGLEAHSDDAPGGNPDDGLAATKQDSKALPFHDGVKAADEYLAFVAHPGDGIEGLEDNGAGTLGGAEEANLGTCQQFGGSGGPELNGCAAAKPVSQRLWICWSSQADGRDLIFESHR